MDKSELNTEVFIGGLIELVARISTGKIMILDLILMTNRSKH